VTTDEPALHHPRDARPEMLPPTPTRVDSIPAIVGNPGGCVSGLGRDVSTDESTATLFPATLVGRRYHQRPNALTQMTELPAIPRTV
jgi:hypothetical protein